MEHTTSADGTRIAFHRFGSGRPVVVVGGAFSTSEAARPIAEAMAEVGLQGVAYDRRGRGGSGDADRYAPEREVEDLQAVIDAVSGQRANGDATSSGGAVVLGHSSGAVLVLLAASAGVPIAHLFLSEPPFHFGVDDTALDLADRLETLVEQGRNGEAVTLFLREGVGLPGPVIEAIQAGPGFDAMAAIARTTVYDTRLTNFVSTPTAAMLAVDAPTTILRGDPTFPFLVSAAEKLAEAMPGAELVVVPESHDHGVDPAGTAREVRTRLA